MRALIPAWLMLTGCISGPMAPTGNPSLLTDTELCIDWSAPYFTNKRLEYRFDVWDEIEARELFTADQVSVIRTGQITIGMPQLAVICAFGRPTDINRTVTAAGSREQWVYRSGNSVRYVYVTNGLVTGYQD